METRVIHRLAGFACQPSPYPLLQPAPYRLPALLVSFPTSAGGSRWAIPRTLAVIDTVRPRLTARTIRDVLEVVNY